MVTGTQGNAISNEPFKSVVGWIDFHILPFLSILALASFLAFLAAFFSFGVKAAFFFPSLLLLRSFVIVFFRVGVNVSGVVVTTLRVDSSSIFFSAQLCEKGVFKVNKMIEIFA